MASGSGAEGEAVSGAQLIAESLKAQVRARVWGVHRRAVSLRRAGGDTSRGAGGAGPGPGHGCPRGWREALRGRTHRGRSCRRPGGGHGGREGLGLSPCGKEGGAAAAAQGAGPGLALPGPCAAVGRREVVTPLRLPPVIH